MPFMLVAKKEITFAWYTNVISYVAAELGFEPRQTESESVVLPLHNSAMLHQRVELYITKRLLSIVFLKSVTFFGLMWHIDKTRNL